MIHLSTPKKGLLIFALSLIVQLLYLADSYNDPTFYRPIVDAGTYHIIAEQIAEGTYTLNTPYYQPPLFPYLLSFVYRLSNNSMLAAKLVLSVGGALTSLLTFLVGSRLTGTRTALVAAITVTLYGPLVFFNSRFLPAGMATMLYMLTLWTLLRAHQSRTILSWLSAGVCLGIAAACVPNILIFLPAIPAWLFMTNGQHLHLAIKNTLPVCLGAALAIAPVTLSNFINSGQFCLISYNGGLNFYIGNNLNADQTIAIRPSLDWENLDKMPMRNGIYTATAQNRFYIKKTLDDIAQKPLLFSKRLLHKLRQFTNSRELPRNIDLYVFRKYSPLLSVLVWRIGSLGFPFGIIFPLACIGMLNGVRLNRDHLLPVIFIFIYTCSVALFFVSARYRVVITPILCIYFAYGLSEMWRMRRTIRSFAISMLIVGIAALWTNTPVTTPTDHIPFEAEMYHFLALQSNSQGSHEQAERELELALNVAPDYAEAYNTRGIILMEDGRLEEAMVSFEQATGLMFNFAEAWHNMGRTAERLGNPVKAEHAFHRAIFASPETAKLYKDLGKFLFFQGRISEALPFLKRAISIDVTIHEAYGILAWIMSTSPDEKFRNGRQALIWAQLLIRTQGEGSPMWTDILAAAYAELGDFEKAITAEERAIELWHTIGRNDIAELATQRLETYKKHEPFRDSDGMEKFTVPTLP